MAKNIDFSAQCAEIASRLEDAYTARNLFQVAREIITDVRFVSDASRNFCGAKLYCGTAKINLTSGKPDVSIWSGGKRYAAPLDDDVVDALWWALKRYFEGKPQSYIYPDIQEDEDRYGEW